MVRSTCVYILMKLYINFCCVVLAMEDKIGNFEVSKDDTLFIIVLCDVIIASSSSMFQVGKHFDALVVDTLAPPIPAPVFDTFETDSFDVSLRCAWL